VPGPSDPRSQAQPQPGEPSRDTTKTEKEKDKAPEKLKPGTIQQATFGGGCFWCTEAVFQRVPGVKMVVSGYSGGSVPFPTYEMVCTGTTGHAEVVNVAFDPALVSYEKLLEIFWRTHNPNTPNAQGPDVGTQYRSIILFHDEEQRRTAESIKKALDESGAFKKPIVTQIVPYTKFFKAHDDHQDYFSNHPENPYCSIVIAPKVEKFEKVFKDRLRK